MNDDQTDKMLLALARAFDKAAMSCSVKEQAALYMRDALKRAGFKIVAVRQ
jgi:hypothetical protein